MTDPTDPGPDARASARIAAEAHAFRALVAHLQARTDVQNIDLMNLSGFCRNCLGKWLKAGADAEGLPMTADEARDAVYGMPFAAWKAAHQAPATPEQLARFDETRPLHARHRP